VKKIKGLKKVKKFGIGKFLVMALVLGGGLIYGTQMAQKNQDNRSSARMIVGDSLKKGATKPTTVKRKCTNNTTKCDNGQMYYCNNGEWKTGVKCPSNKCSGNTCEKVVSTPTPVVTCKYNGVTIYNGRSQCINLNRSTSEAGVSKVTSEMISCVNGKTKKIAVYQESNCAIKKYDKNEDVHCNDGMKSGESTCFNVGSNSSEMRTCVAGNSKVVASYAVKDCGKIGD